jgi:hypothetical protein
MSQLAVRGREFKWIKSSSITGNSKSGDELHLATAPEYKLYNGFVARHSRIRTLFSFVRFSGCGKISSVRDWRAQKQSQELLFLRVATAFWNRSIETSGWRQALDGVPQQAMVCQRARFGRLREDFPTGYSK